MLLHNLALASLAVLAFPALQQIDGQGENETARVRVNRGGRLGVLLLCLDQIRPRVHRADDADRDRVLQVFVRLAEGFG